MSGKPARKPRRPLGADVRGHLMENEPEDEIISVEISEQERLALKGRALDAIWMIPFGIALVIFVVGSADTGSIVVAGVCLIAGVVALVFVNKAKKKLPKFVPPPPPPKPLTALERRLERART